MPDYKFVLYEALDAPAVKDKGAGRAVDIRHPTGS
jgi:hypothetical protein